LNYEMIWKIRKKIVKSILSISFHNSTYFSSAFSISFHCST
jgi:hypothetical protein